MTEETAADRVRELLEGVLDGMDIDGDVDVTDDGDTIVGTLHGDDMGIVIGRHGQTIDAIQHLAYKAAMRGGGQGRRVVIDAAGYRDRRRQVLERQADQAADEALRSGSPVALVPMSATERKVVNEYLKERSGLETYSEGTEPHRHLVVAPTARFT